MLVILIYPILDVNFLYHAGETQKINLLQDLASLDQNAMSLDPRLVDGYSAILDDLTINRSHEVSQVINFNDATNGWINLLLEPGFSCWRVLSSYSVKKIEQRST